MMTTPRKSPPDYEVEHHVIKIWSKCQKCLKITPNLHNARTALFVNPLVEKGDEWNFWSRKKLHLERPPTHPFLLLLCCRVKPCTTPLLFHIVSSQCFHIDTVIDMVIEKSTLVQTASGELCFFISQELFRILPTGQCIVVLLSLSSCRRFDIWHSKVQFHIEGNRNCSAPPPMMVQNFAQLPLSTLELVEFYCDASQLSRAGSWGMKSIGISASDDFSSWY